MEREEKLKILGTEQLTVELNNQCLKRKSKKKSEIRRFLEIDEKEDIGHMKNCTKREIHNNISLYQKTRMEPK